MIIAIDGPAGAGKSTIARALAAQLGLHYLDTGAMYRAVACGVIRRGIDPTDRQAVADALPSLVIVIDDSTVTVDGFDATTAIRGREVTNAVTPVAANPAVRAELRQRQRDWANRHGGGVIEGRDIGSVVFPDAEWKLYLTASPRIRAERRVAESGGDLDEIEAAISRRDAADAARSDGPLVEAAGATVVDTSGLTIAEVVATIETLMERT